jgi:hypothetical protein
MSQIINEVHVTGNCRGKGYTEKISSTSAKPVWYEQDATRYEYCEDGVGSSKRYYRKAKSVTTTTTTSRVVTTTTTSRVTPPPPSTGYSDCGGPKYYQGCKDPGSGYGDPDPDGDIYKVQGCIGAKQDSLFGPRTKSKLKAATGKVTFKVEDIATICKESVVDGGQSTPQTVDEQRKYWNNLIENEQIWRKGYLLEKNGKVVYVIKTDLENPDVKYPLENLSGADLTKFDYIVMFIPEAGSKTGKWGLLAVTTTPNGEQKVIVQTNPSWTWEPNEKQDYVDLLESRIKNVLKSKLQEQRFFGRTKKTADDGKGVNTSGGNISKGTENKTDNKTVVSGPVKADPTKVKEVVEPLRVETIKLLEEIKGMNFFQIGASDKDKKSLDDAIKLLQNFDSSKACEAENQELINQNMKILNDMISANENKLGAEKIVEKAKQVRANLERVKSECDRLNSEANKSQGSSSSSSSSSTSTISTPKESEDLLVKFGFVRSDGRTYNPKEAIELLGKQPLGNSGEGTLQSAIDKSSARSEHFADYNKLVGSLGLSDQYKLKIPMSSKQKPGQVITEDNESILFPLRDSGSKSQYVEDTFGTFLGTVTPNAKIYLGKKQTSATQGSDIMCSIADPRGYLIKYLIRGLKASTVEDTGTLQEEKQTICGCYKSGAYDNFKPITKDEFVNITKDKKPFGWLFNRSLTWNDVKKLMKGESVSGERIEVEAYHDSSFGETSCIAPLQESLRFKIKNKISEAIKDKKILTESLQFKILKDIKRRH